MFGVYCVFVLAVRLISASGGLAKSEMAVWEFVCDNWMQPSPGTTKMGTEWFYDLIARFREFQANRVPSG